MYLCMDVRYGGSNVKYIECFIKVVRDISFARIFPSSCCSDRAGNFAVVGCIQLDDSQQDWVYGLRAVVLGYDVDCYVKTLNSCYTSALGAKRIPYLRCPLWYTTRASCTCTAYNRRWYTTIPLGSGLSPSVTLANYSGISGNGSRSAYPVPSILVAVSSWYYDRSSTRALYAAGP